MTPWYERDPDRYQAEKEFWVGNGFREERTGGKVTFVGTIEVQAGSRDRKLEKRSFELRVVYPHGFPYRPQEVEFIQPRVRRGRHQSPGGAPCLFPARAWTPFVPAAEVYKSIHRWLKSTMLNSFPREQAIYELPEYFPASNLSILIAVQGMAAFGKERGRFSMVRSAGRDLAVVRTVDRVQVAADLLAGLRLGAEVKQQVINAKWFRLREEPGPIRHTGELEALLSGNGHSFTAPRGPDEDEGFVGLVFPDSVTGEERFFVFDYCARKRAQRDPRGWPLRAAWVYLVSPEELFRRIQDVRPVDELQGKHVVVLGVGAIGSSLALDLAREGVAGFLLCDDDRLRPGNIVRHGLDLFSVGDNKAEAVELAIGRVNPFVDTRAESENLRDPGALANLMRTDHPVHPVDLVVSAIGEDAMEGLVSELAVRSESAAPVLFVRTLHDGDAIRIMLLRPGRGDACLNCLRLHAQDENPDLIEAPDGVLDPVFDYGCGTGAVQGAGLTSRHAAVLGTKRALAVLLAEDGDENHWVWVERAIPDAPDERLHTGERMYAARIPVHPDCPFCS